MVVDLVRLEVLSLIVTYTSEISLDVLLAKINLQ